MIQLDQLSHLQTQVSGAAATMNTIGSGSTSRQSRLHAHSIRAVQYLMTAESRKLTRKDLEKPKYALSDAWRMSQCRVYTLYVDLNDFLSSPGYVGSLAFIVSLVGRLHVDYQ